MQRWDHERVRSDRSFVDRLRQTGNNPAFVNPFDVSVSSETGKVFVVDDDSGNSVEQFELRRHVRGKWDAPGSADGAVR